MGDQSAGPDTDVRPCWLGHLVADNHWVLLSQIEPQVVAALSPDTSREGSTAATHLLWYCDGTLAAFLVSWFCTTVLRLDNDLYYAILIWSGLTFLYYYVKITNVDVIGAVRNRWQLSMFVGGLVSIYVALNVWNTTPTEHPGGVELVFELLWRGVAYGIANSLVLTAFPMAVAYGVFGGDVSGTVRRVGFGALTLVLVLMMSFTYHRGFEQFEEDPVTPQLVTTSVSVPAIVSANPIGSIVAQTSLHVVATFRTFESDVFVPPEVEFVPDYEPPGVFGPR